MNSLSSAAPQSARHTLDHLTRPHLARGSKTADHKLSQLAEGRAAKEPRWQRRGVGVISDGIDHVADAQQSGDLPNVTGPSGGCRRGSGDEGTALLEIVHDVAPGAELLFAGPRDSFETIQAIQCLTAAGADLIVDDLGFLGEPYFQDGPVAAAVLGVVHAGVSSAGFEARQHVEQDFVATPNSTLHDFAGGARDNTNTVVVPPGGTLTCVLEWNDPFGASANDYDLSSAVIRNIQLEHLP